jgi:hypothetical protein
MKRVLMCVAAGVAAAAGTGEVVLLEAEGFEKLGGWVVDQQSMDQMGSPYLLAHGMGEPVAEATTTAKIPADGEYQVLVRTRDWVAPHGPGKFNVVIGGEPLKAVFGAQGDGKWFWQDGGKVTLKAGDVTVALRDLTGFEGRCDAILLVKGGGVTPPAELKEMAAWRRKLLGLADKPKDAGAFDLVVVGGGIAGTCAAVEAARWGLRVALIQDRPVLGGNNSSEVRVHRMGGLNGGQYPELPKVVAELGRGNGGGNARPADHYGDDDKLRLVQSEKNLQIFLNTHANGVEKQGNRIAAVLAKNILTNEDLRFAAAFVADCTGDGTVGFLAGAEYRHGRESKAETGEALAPEKADKQTMGSTNMWYAKDTGAPAPFPECPWALKITKGEATGADWNWETGFLLDQANDTERIRDHNFRAIYGTWDFTKNRSPLKAKYANFKLDWVAYVAGKRESRRLLGDVILTQQDVVDAKPFPDACVVTTWTIDLHYPTAGATKDFPGEEFRSEAKHVKIKPYPIPYRCLYSRNVPNLFMAGRNISVTHVALGTVRVQNTTGMMGVVVGRAASLCKKYNATPRDVYDKYLEQLKDALKQPSPKAGTVQ